MLQLGLKRANLNNNSCIQNLVAHSTNLHDHCTLNAPFTLKAKQKLTWRSRVRLEKLLVLKFSVSTPRNISNVWTEAHTWNLYLTR